MKIKKKERKTPQINTTALPDIIFMLLFFFMVTTVMQPKQKQAALELPASVTQESTVRSKPNELMILLAQANENDSQYFINGRGTQASNFSTALNSEIAKMKKEQNFPKKAILRIDKKIKMSQVNEVKLALQKLNILKIEYIHRKD